MVAEANRIFGFEGWDRETVASDCVWTKQQGSRYCAAYVARVRITVRAGETRIIREGCGVGESSALSPGQAHDFAAKAAETDATKRALMTFGNAFGLSLYGGTGATPVSGARQRSKSVAAHPGQALPQASEPAASAAQAGATRPVVDEALHPQRRRQIMSPPPISSRATATSRASGPSTRVSWRWPSRGASATPSTCASWQASPAWSAGRSPSEAHHLRFAQPRAMSRKVSDEFTVPLCALHHRDLHARGNEEAWWQERKIEPLDVAADLWRTSRRLGGPSDTISGARAGRRRRESRYAELTPCRTGL